MVLCHFCPISTCPIRQTEWPKQSQPDQVSNWMCHPVRCNNCTQNVPRERSKSSLKSPFSTSKYISNLRVTLHFWRQNFGNRFASSSKVARKSATDSWIIESYVMTNLEISIYQIQESERNVCSAARFLVTEIFPMKIQQLRGWTNIQATVLGPAKTNLLHCHIWSMDPYCSSECVKDC